jgi:hypothetical protein
MLCSKQFAFGPFSSSHRDIVWYFQLSVSHTKCDAAWRLNEKIVGHLEPQPLSGSIIQPILNYSKFNI